MLELSRNVRVSRFILGLTSAEEKMFNLSGYHILDQQGCVTIIYGPLSATIWINLHLALFFFCITQHVFSAPCSVRPCCWLYQPSPCYSITCLFLASMKKKRREIIERSTVTPFDVLAPLRPEHRAHSGSVAQNHPPWYLSSRRRPSE